MDKQRQDKLDPVEVVAHAIAALGEDTAASIATRAEMAYSTVTPKLRALEEAGRAEKIKREGRTFWRLTGDATGAAAPDTTGSAGSGAGGPCGGDHTAREHPDLPDAADGAGQPHQPTERANEEPHARHGDETAPSRPPAAAQPPAAQPDQSTATEPVSPDVEANDGTDSGESEPADDGAPPHDDIDARAADAAAAPKADAEQAASPQHDASAEEPADDADSVSDQAQPAADATPAAGRTRRPPGELGRTALAIMQAHPQTAYKVGEMAKLIDQADDGKGYPKASPGAVVLALDTLVDGGKATKVSDKPATYQRA